MLWIEILFVIVFFFNEIVRRSGIVNFYVKGLFQLLGIFQLMQFVGIVLVMFVVLVLFCFWCMQFYVIVWVWSFFDGWFWVIVVYDLGFVVFEVLICYELQFQNCLRWIGFSKFEDLCDCCFFEFEDGLNYCVVMCVVGVDGYVLVFVKLFFVFGSMVSVQMLIVMFIGKEMQSRMFLVMQVVQC